MVIILPIKDLFHTRSTANDYTTQLAETFRITYQGNVGINESNPTSQLVVSATSMIIQQNFIENLVVIQQVQTGHLVLQLMLRLIIEVVVEV